MPNDELAGALGGLSLHAVLILMSKALARAGYGDVEVQGRRHPRQRSRRGGHELACASYVGKSPVRVLVKVLDQDVRTRNLDEMAGALRRNRADLGIVATTAKVSPRMARSLGRYLPARIEAMDGRALASFVARSGIATRPDGSVDYAYLSALEEYGERVLDFARKEAL